MARTTVTLDADVEQLLKESMQRGGRTFKQALNEAVRRGLKPLPDEAEPPFVVAARPLGLRAGIDPAQIRDLDDELEIEDFLDKTRRLDSTRSKRS